MKDFMLKDRAQHTILPLSKFGLMQITRQRVRPELKINTAEVCSTCNGTGILQSQPDIKAAVETDLANVMLSRPRGKVTLHVHPFFESYLREGFPSRRMRWYMKYQKWIALKPEPDYPMSTYKFFDDNQEEIRFEAN